MTRPKVPDDKRQRTAQACDSCKRRKQKCNGLKPCNTCSKRSLICSYTPSNADQNSDDLGGSPTKRRHIDHDNSPPALPAAGESAASKSSQPEEESPPQKEVPPASQPAPSSQVKLESESQKPSAEPVIQHQRHLSDVDLEIHSRNSTISGADEDAPLYSTTRMLQDQTGRLLYLGDSATLSYLHLFRLMVENTSGPSPFTTDPRKERIVENVVSLPPHIRPPCPLPDRDTAKVLVDSYFTNTSGLIEVFDQKSFRSSFETCCSDPLSADSSFLCHLNLVFAIGLVLATPFPGSREDMIIKKLRSMQFDQAELFFRSAKCLSDPLTGFEDADFWSVQALLLMSVYMLAVSKRNASYAYHGMAVRSAFALGLHREETMIVFHDARLILRCNLWRSIFILDRFLAASLGRPCAISEDDCSEAALRPPPPLEARFSEPHSTLPHSEGVDAAVKTCRVIGLILKKIYAHPQRRVLTKSAQDIAKQSLSWPQRLHFSLHWRQPLSGRVSATQGTAILHVNLLYCHSVILLTRPFFLHLVQAHRSGPSLAAPRPSSRMERFSETCIAASNHTISMIQTAYEASYLPQRNPFVIYFLFAAALVILSNEFAALYQNPEGETRVSQSIALMAYCAETDPQGDRLLWILRAFQDVVAKQTTGSRTYRFSMPAILLNPPLDPMSSFFSTHGNHSQASDYSQFRRPSVPNISRHNSLPSSTTVGIPTIKPAASPTKPQGTVAPNGTILQPLSTGTLPSPGPQYGLDSAPEREAGDPMSTDAEGFDLDSLWNWHQPGAATQPPTVTAPSHFAGLPTSAPRYDTFPGYSGSAGSNGMGSGNSGINMNVPLYPTSDFG